MWVATQELPIIPVFAKHPKLPMFTVAHGDKIPVVTVMAAKASLRRRPLGRSVIGQPEA